MPDYYQLKIDGKVVCDRLIQNASARRYAELVSDCNVPANILKLYAAKDPQGCYAAWGGTQGLLKIGTVSKNTITVEGKTYEFTVQPELAERTHERCYRNNVGARKIRKEPFWILAPATRPGTWLVCPTDREKNRRHLSDILHLCNSDFFQKFGIKVTLKKM